MAEPEKLSTPVVNTGKSLDTTVHDPTWWQSTTVDQNYIDRIKSWIDNTNPGAVRLAGLYYTAAEPLLVGFASDLKTKAGELAEAHKGPAAYEMQLQLRSLAASARELATKLADVGRSLTGYADTLVWAQQNVVETTYRDSRSDRDIDWAATLNPFNSVNRGNQRAVEYLKQVNQRIVEQYQQLPTEVQYALPDPNDIDMSDFGGIGAGGIGAGSGVPASYTGAGPARAAMTAARSSPAKCPAAPRAAPAAAALLRPANTPVPWRTEGRAAAAPAPGRAAATRSAGPMRPASPTPRSGVTRPEESRRGLPRVLRPATTARRPWRATTPRRARRPAPRTPPTPPPPETAPAPGWGPGPGSTPVPQGARRERRRQRPPPLGREPAVWGSPRWACP
ncbi:hypothetical protein ACFQYP_44555 [Nonomuraea antimicrobica]